MSSSDLENVKKFYDQRYREKGNSITSVGWASTDSQELRFRMLLRNIDVANKTILDIGCGLGDLVLFLEKQGIEFNYIGIDISSELIQASKELHKLRKNVQFFETDLLGFDDKNFNIDITFLSGALTYKVEDNLTYAKSVLSKMIYIAKEVATSNFMSSYVDFQNEKNFHYRPEDMFTFGRSLTPRVNIYHDYPLYEFTLQLFK